MKDDKLPTIKDIKVAITLKKVTIQDVIKGFENMLLAHEQHAEEMIKELKKKYKSVDTSMEATLAYLNNIDSELAYWRGRLEALQAFKGRGQKDERQK